MELTIRIPGKNESDRGLKKHPAMKACGWQAKKRKGSFGTECRSLRRWQAQEAGRRIKLKP